MSPLWLLSGVLLWTVVSAAPLQPTFTPCHSYYNPAAGINRLNVSNVYANLVSGSRAVQLGLPGDGSDVLRVDLVGVLGSPMLGFDESTNKLGMSFARAGSQGLTTSYLTHRYYRWRNIGLQVYLMGLQLALPRRPSVPLPGQQRNVLPAPGRPLCAQYLHPPLPVIRPDDTLNASPHHRHYCRRQYALMRRYLVHAVRPRGVVLQPVPVAAGGPGRRVLDHQLGRAFRRGLGHRQRGGRVRRQDEGSVRGDAAAGRVGQKGKTGRADAEVGNDAG
jgi:hypothetical protein